jgi:(heptosyl)LPS beta-1,4-glucosyltransferase
MNPLSKLPLSVIIITCNEADRLPRTLASISWADQVVVVDSGSEDATCEVATSAGAEVVSHAWEGYSAQKSFAVGLTRHDWVLWLDADEEVSAPLAASIRLAMDRQASRLDRCHAYALNRRTCYLGRFLRFGGWYPDRKVRLFHKGSAEFDGRAVHEDLVVDGEIGFLPGDLFHYTYRDLTHHIRKTHEFAEVWARERADQRPVRGWELVVHPAAKAVKSYFVRGGFLEGWRGMLLAGMASYSVWLKYALLKEYQEGRRRRSS